MLTKGILQDRLRCLACDAQALGSRRTATLDDRAWAARVVAAVTDLVDGRDHFRGQGLAGPSRQTAGQRAKSVVAEFDCIGNTDSASATLEATLQGQGPCHRRGERAAAVMGHEV